MSVTGISLDDLLKMGPTPSAEEVARRGLVPPPVMSSLTGAPGAAQPQPVKVSPMQPPDNSVKPMEPLQVNVSHTLEEPKQPELSTVNPTRQESGQDIFKGREQQFKDRIGGLDPSSPTYASDLAGTKIGQAEYEKQHHWGEPESAHPGIGGKIGHVIGEAANIGGDIFAPKATSLIPGSQLNRAIGERNDVKDFEGARNLESEEGLRQTQGAADTSRAATEAQEAPAKIGLETAQTGEAGARANEANANADLARSGGKPSEVEKQMSDYMQANNLPATPQGREQARVAMFNQAHPSDIPTGDKGAAAMNAIITNSLKKEGLDKDADLYQVDPKDSVTTANTKLKQAQEDIANHRAQQSAERQAGAPERAEQAKEKGNLYYSEVGGKQVAGTADELRSAGVGTGNLIKVGEGETEKIINARTLTNQFNKQGDSPDTMGIVQLAESLNKDGKLGPLVSRWNDILTHTVGVSPDDDPRVISLFNKLDLAQTALMQVHFGASGGRSPVMLEHFQQMANAKKMDGPTLLAGIKAENNYVADKAMRPANSGAGGASKVPSFADWQKGQGH